jgi:hypothetical protein
MVSDQAKTISPSGRNGSVQKTGVRLISGSFPMHLKHSRRWVFSKCRPKGGGSHSRQAMNLGGWYMREISIYKLQIPNKLQKANYKSQTEAKN